MNGPKGPKNHMWLFGMAAVGALFLGLGVGWVLAAVLLGCGSMVAALFWIERTSTPPGPIRQIAASRETSSTTQSSGNR